VGVRWEPMDLEPFGLTTDDLTGFLGLALQRGGEFSELFLEHRTFSSIRMEEDLIKDTAESLVLGLGVRVLKGDQTGFGYTNDLSPESIRRAALSASSIASAAAEKKPLALEAVRPGHDLYPVRSLAHAAPLQAKIELVREAYIAAQGFHPSVTKVNVALVDSLQTVLIVNSEGLLAADSRPLVRLGCLAVVEKNGRREAGFSGGGGRVGLEYYARTMTPQQIGRDAAQEAVSLLEARPAPAGEMSVVLAPGHSGVLIHEAVGHLLEADFIRKKTSVFWDKLGRRVGTTQITIYDDPTIPFFRGSYNIDDEGTAPRKTLLIDRGIMTGLLQDRLSAKVLGRSLTGHGRRQDFSCYPIPRMSNIFIDRGPSDPQDIIRSVTKGIYAGRFQGGQVEDSGKFTFSVSSGFLIEGGRLTAPIKQATLIGSNLDILHRIVLVGSDLGFSLQTGTCSKEGQDVPVTDGCPTLKVERMTVGGSV
jgi:TldD protein